MKWLKTVLPLVLFILLLYFAYSLLFTHHRLRDARRELQTMETQLGSIIHRLEAAQLSLDTAMARLESSRREMSQLRQNADNHRDDFLQDLDSAFVKLQRLQARMQTQWEEISQLQDQLRALEK
jgi:uncharacterized protein (DUF3084 family)